MDVDSSSSDELHPIEEGLSDGFGVFEYTDIDSHSGIIRAVITKDLEEVRNLVHQGRSPRNNDNHGNTPLHVAVVTADEDDLEIVKFLIGLEEVDINALNHYGHSPLLLCTKNKKVSAALALIEAGANFRLFNRQDSSPLHFSVRYSTKVSEALILAGADINHADHYGDTPLHDNVIYGDVETLCMLLYYGADTSITNQGNMTPFMQSLGLERIELADELFEYVTDFNITSDALMSTLFIAISTRYSRIIDIVRRGADINYTNGLYDVFSLGVAPSLEVFEYLWNRFDYKNIRMNSSDCILWDLFNHFNVTREYKLEALNIILNSRNINNLIGVTSRSEKSAMLSKLVESLCRLDVSHNEIYRVCVILLSHNLKVYEEDLDLVYKKFGYCQLFKFLLHMNIQGRLRNTSQYFPRLVYELNAALPLLEISFASHRFNLFAVDYLDIFDHIAHPTLKGMLTLALEARNEDESTTRNFMAYLNSFPDIPKLQELASHKAKQFICEQFNLRTCLQFYTYLNWLDIPKVLKDIISFETPLYRFCVADDLREYIENFS